MAIAFSKSLKLIKNKRMLRFLRMTLSTYQLSADCICGSTYGYLQTVYFFNDYCGVNTNMYCLLSLVWRRGWHTDTYPECEMSWKTLVKNHKSVAGWNLSKWVFVLFLVYLCSGRRPSLWLYHLLSIYPPQFGGYTVTQWQHCSLTATWSLD